MNKIAIVYWSGTGNTEIMANCIADGARGAGAAVDVLSPGQFSAADVDNYQAIAFGCPAMGAEQLDEDEFEPMFSGVEGGSLRQKGGPVRLLRLGRRPVDAGLVRAHQRRRRQPLRRGGPDAQRHPRQRGRGRLSGPGPGPGGVVTARQFFW